MKQLHRPDARIGTGVLLGLAVILLTLALGFHFTGPVNQIPRTANAPAVTDR
ncbi:hypothetical protein [Bradyrhizobium sp. LHD-71]|uniref:hypothetical protein n=1 Tax=Bradyrhizobium sp. LHD-71 TaxID=3072141 RepID=UPI00280ECFDF|nr:hypothetical protein [Bradyrhizobium sp. LHD-71]MDQ8729373.1 hypothetical protein [Bradyrhizobium sp. LHD-71]